MPTTVDPTFEELMQDPGAVEAVGGAGDAEDDTDMELPDASGGGGVPGLPPLAPGDEAEVEEEEEEEVEEEEEAIEEEGEGGTATAETTKQYGPVPAAQRVRVQFASDLPKTRRPGHPSGILHFPRIDPKSGSEEHAFAWICRKDVSSHLRSVLSHMEGFGFDPAEVSFVPYSARGEWVRKYPLAFPHVHCDERGTVFGHPYFSPAAVERGSVYVEGSHAAGGLSSAIKLELLGGGDVDLATENTPQKGKPGRKRKKSLPHARLPNDDRDELHVEIYRYLTWLRGGVAEQAVPGIDPDELAKLAEGMEATFRAVRSARAAVRAEGEEAAEARKKRRKLLHRGGQDGAVSEEANHVVVPVPFLEEALVVPLGRMADAAKRDPKRRASRKSSGGRGSPNDFDEMFARLVHFQREHGHVNVPQKYSKDGQLGSWVANMRSKRKQLAKKGLDFELEVTPEEEAREMEEAAAAAGAGEDVEDAAGEEDGAVGAEGGADQAGGAEGGIVKKKRKRHRGGRQRLTRERIHRMDSIGFQWIVGETHTASRPPASSFFARSRFAPPDCGLTLPPPLSIARPAPTRASQPQHQVVGGALRGLEGVPGAARDDARAALVRDPGGVGAHAASPLQQEGQELPREEGSPGKIGVLSSVASGGNFAATSESNPGQNPSFVLQLEDIGFEWQPRKHAVISWEDNFQRLVEFGRINRHYNVQSPFPEGYVGDYEGDDPELVEAHRFFKWVKRIHAEYRSYLTGKGSRMLNDGRVMQLREIGFQFM
ncbi:hypothetical protein ACHAWF_015139 [Thalassiosira exigua]